MRLKTYGWVAGEVEQPVIAGKEQMWFYLHTPLTPGGQEMQKIRCHFWQAHLIEKLTDNRMVCLEGDCVVGVETADDGQPQAMLSVYCNTLKILR